MGKMLWIVFIHIRICTIFYINKNKTKRFTTFKEIAKIISDNLTICLQTECSPMVWETGVQSQVASYQRLEKWYLIYSWLTLSIIRYGSGVKWSNPGKGVAPFPTPRCCTYWKGSLLVTLDDRRQLSFFISSDKLIYFFLHETKQISLISYAC